MADSIPREGWTAKRAGRACLSCRTRKIRCNVEQQGPPCSNCLTDGIAGCQVVKSMRGKRSIPASESPAKRAGAKASSSTQAIVHLDDSEPSSLGPAQVSPTHTTGWLDDTEDLPDLHPTILTVRDQSPRHSPAQLDARFFHQGLSYAGLIGKEPRVPRRWPGAPTPPRSLTAQSQASHTSPCSASLDANKRLPDFIRPLPPTLSTVDLDYLHLKGALDIPSMGFLKALLTAFVQFVHPYAPVLDVSTICRVLRGESGCISILTLQSMAFVAVPYVDMDYIHSVGFTSRRACRKAFYEKARLLYDHDVEPDKLATIQSVLLLSYWGEQPGDSRGCWYWMGIATTLALILGLHRKAEYRVESPGSRLRVRKQVWWACYLRDRMLGLALGRPLRIRDVDVDTPPLTLEDFEIVDDSPGGGGDSMGLPSREDQIALAERCIHQVELCKLLARVLELHFSMLPGERRSTTATQDDNGATSAMIFLKDDDGASEHLVQQYDQQLQAWYSNLPPVCVYQAPEEGQQSRRPCLLVSAAALHTTFWSVVSALHRPQLRHQNSGASIERVWKAAIEVSRCNRELHRSGLDRYLPAISSMTFQHTAFIIHAKRLASRKARSDVTEILDALFFCIKVHEVGRERFPAGDSGMGFMLCVAKMSRITLLFDQESKLWGIGYQGVHYSPGSQQLTLDSRPSVALPVLDAVDVGRPETPLDTGPFADDHLVSTGTRRDGQCVYSELPLFDQMDDIDWSSLADFMPMGNLEYERSLGTSVNLDDYIHDVEMMG